jgi:hypothetical protein
MLTHEEEQKFSRQLKRQQLGCRWKAGAVAYPAFGGVCVHLFCGRSAQRPDSGGTVMGLMMKTVKQL